MPSGGGKSRTVKQKIPDLLPGPGGAEPRSCGAKMYAGKKSRRMMAESSGRNRFAAKQPLNQFSGYRPTGKPRLSLNCRAAAESVQRAMALISAERPPGGIALLRQQPLNQFSGCRPTGKPRRGKHATGMFPWTRLSIPTVDKQKKKAIG